MRKTRIAFIAEILIKDYDGASRTMHQIIERIPSDRFEFKFICGVPPKSDIGYSVKSLPSMPIPFNTHYKMAIPYISQDVVKDELNAFEPDLIHISSPSPLGHFVLNYAQKRNIPVVTIYHTHFLSYVDYYLRHVPFLISGMKSLISKSQKQFYDHCDLILMPTKTIKNELQDFDFKVDHMVLWERGLDQDLFDPSKKDQAYIHSVVKNDGKNLLFASRLVWEKNLQTLINLYKLSHEENRRYNFIIAGDGQASQSLRSEMPDAFFLGNLDHEELSKLYASCDVFVFPSHSETYGNVVIEAMASGLPCVIANGGGSASFIQQGINGYKVKTHNEDDYLKAIDKILNDKVLRTKVIANGLSFTKTLSWDALVNRYFNMISALSINDQSPQVA